MLSRAMRRAQAGELLACILLAYALHLHGWSVAAAVLSAAALPFAIRLLLSLLSMFFGWRWRSPRERLPAGATLRLLGGEYFALLRFNMVDVPWEGRLMRPDPAPQRGARLPIVLAHGFYANRGCFRRLAQRLEDAGLGAVHAPNLRSFGGADIEAYEEGLHAVVERIAEGSGQRVILVGHSMGGLGARAYLARRGSARVARLVTIASPHQGTVLARLGEGANARQMQRGSTFLRELAKREAASPPPIPALSIYTPHDNLVMPQDSSRLPWARALAIPGVGHLGILECEALWRALAAEIEAAHSP